MKCPIYNSNLEYKLVAPCYECGAFKDELSHFYKQIHDYYKCTIFEEDAIFCDFCFSDIDSYYPEFWGLPKNSIYTNNYPVKFIKKLDVDNLKAEFDHYCSKCSMRLMYTKVVKKIREKKSS